MKRSCALLLPFLLALAPAVMADEEFYRKLESRPAGKSGTWVMGGRSITVTESTRLNEEDCPLVVGACVEVKYENGAVEEIETEDDPGN